MPNLPSGPIERAVKRSVRAAKAEGALKPADAAAIAALIALAHKVDMLDPDDHSDNWSLPTLLKELDQLGLSPAGRKQFNASSTVPKASSTVSPKDAPAATSDAPVVPIHRSWRDSLPA